MIKIISKGLFITALFIRCANPVGPTGGDKDEKSPVIQKVKIESKNQEKNITIIFDENINTKGEITISPYSQKKNIPLDKYRNILNFTVPNNTNSISLNDVITDVNENNPGKYPFIIIGKDSFNFIVKYQSTNSTKDKVKGYFQIDSLYYPGDNSEKGLIKFGGLKNINNTVTLFNDINNNNKYDLDEEYYIQEVASQQYYRDSLKDTLSVNTYPSVKKEIKRSLIKQDSLAVYIGIPKSIIDSIKIKEQLYIINHFDTTLINIKDTSEIENQFNIINQKLKISQVKIELPVTGNIIYKIGVTEKDTIIKTESTIGYILSKKRKNQFYFYSKEETKKYKIYNKLNYPNIYSNPFEINIQNESKKYITSKKDTFYKNIKYKIGLLNIKNKIKNFDSDKIKIKLINSKNYSQVFTIKKNENIYLDQDTYHYFIWEDTNNNNELDIISDNQTIKAERIFIYNKETAINSKLDNEITVE